jgi:aldehyde oxidoreductase
MNRLVLDGHFYGGLVKGVGLALSEDFEDLKKHTTIAACGIPYAKDSPPEMELHYLETPRTLGPFGASGAGEVTLTSPHASIINAIYNACGVRITRLPALPEKILAGLKAKGCCCK